MKNGKKTKNLTAASRLKDDPARDEFYTTPKAAAGMFRYLVPGQLKGKRVYCNCDEPWSEIYGFLKQKYSEFGLAGLTATGMPKTGRGVKAEYDGKEERISEMAGDGSCYSDESLEILSKCDVVATNPPFSNFGKFTELLNGSGKDFLIICNCMSMLNRRQWDMFVASGRKVLFANVGTSNGSEFRRPNGDFARVKIGTFTTLKVVVPPQHRPPSGKWEELIANGRVRICDDGTPEIKFTRDMPLDFDGVFYGPASSAYFPSVRRIFDVLELRSDVAVDGKLLFYRAKFRRKA